MTDSYYIKGHATIDFRDQDALRYDCDGDDDDMQRSLSCIVGILFLSDG